jgi:hypothetical protein
MHIVQQPATGNAMEIEVDLLGRIDVEESGDHDLSVLARSSIRAAKYSSSEVR